MGHVTDDSVEIGDIGMCVCQGDQEFHDGWSIFVIYNDLDLYYMCVDYAVGYL